MKRLLLRCTIATSLAIVAGPALAFNIVLTNDDGFETDNIQALYHALVEAGHDVILSAPYSGQSGTSGAIDFLAPIPPTSEPSPGGTLPAGSPGVGETGLGPQQFYVDGRPAAALLHGVDVVAMKIWGTFPDLVISGPNEGNNLGVVTPHSGTVGAAVTALNKQIPAIALSAASGDADAAAIVAELGVRVVAALDRHGRVALPTGIGLNVNVPEIDAATTSIDEIPFAFTRIGKSADFGLQFFEDLGDSEAAVAAGIPADIGLPGVSIVVPASNAGYPEDRSPRSESNAIEAGFVTISPIQGTYAATDRRISGHVRSTLAPLVGSAK
jgi:5'-nucleotidase